MTSARSTATALATSRRQCRIGLGGRDAAGNPGDQTDGRELAVRLGARQRDHCAVIAQPGKHDWPFASQVFASALPWLAGQIGTPDVPQIPLPDSVTSPAGTTEVNASR